MKVSDSARLQYQLMTAADAELMFKLDQDPEVMRYVTAGKLTTREEIAEIYIPRMESYTNPEKGWGLWKVSLIHDNSFIGWILVRPEDFFSNNIKLHNLELGWRFNRDSWGRGYATEAAEMIKQALIEAGDCTKLSAIAVEDNRASINIMLKLGMSYIKTDIHRDPLGNDEEVVYYQMTV